MSQRASRARKLGATLLASSVAASLSPLFAGVAGAAPAPAPSITAVCANADTTNPFTDLAGASAEALAAINCLTDAGLIAGTTATTFNPNGNLTRAQAAVLIARLADAVDRLDTPGNPDLATLPPVSASTADKFTDDEPAPGNTAAQEIENAINRLAAVGIVQGQTATLFNPNGNVTRGQFASLIARLQAFLETGSATGTSSFNTSTDFFNDDTGSPHEAALNALAGKGILRGDGATASQVNLPISRQQAALVLARHAAVNNANGQIGVLSAPPVSNEGIDVQGDPAGAGLLPDGFRTCTVAGLTPGTTLDAAVFPSADVRVSSSGVVTFSDPDNNNTAEAEEGNGGALIVNVNGAPTGGVPEVNNFVATGNTALITMGAPAVADVTLVVWQDQNGFTANDLDLTVLNSTQPKAPREVFGAGCRTLFANEFTGGGPVAAVVTSTEKATDLFTATIPPAFNFFYDSNDNFQVNNVPLPAGAAGLAAFEALLSPFDTVVVTYAPDAAGVSTFNLFDTQPASPGAVNSNVNGNTVSLGIGESDTPTADSYNVYRIVRPAAAVVCPDFNTAGASGRGLYPTSPTATVADPSPTTDTNVFIPFVDSNLAQNTNFCYAFTTVDDGDESGAPFSPAFQVAALTGSATDTGAPTITDVRAREGAGLVNVLDAGDLLQFIFSEAMDVTSDDNGTVFQLQDADGTSATITCGVNALCALQAAGTFNGAAQANNQVLRILLGVPNITVVGTTPNLQFPVTIVAVSASVRDAALNVLNLTGSADKVIDVALITPA